MLPSRTGIGASSGRGLERLQNLGDRILDVDIGGWYADLGALRPRHAHEGWRHHPERLAVAPVIVFGLVGGAVVKASAAKRAGLQQIPARS